MNGVFSRAVDVFLHLEGTSMFGWLTSLFPTVISGGILLAIVWWKEGLPAVKRQFGKYLTLAALVSIGVFAAWHGIAFLWAIGTTVRGDYRQLVADNQALNKKVENLSDERDGWKRKFETEEKKPKLYAAKAEEQAHVDATAKATVNQDRCWLADHPGLPNSTVPGAVTATTAIIHCNYKIDAPLEVQVEFDRDFLPGAMTFPGSGVVIHTDSGKHGRVYIGRISSPSLLTGNLAIVTVYGTTDKFPHALKASIRTLQ